jgi:tetratricopeptide (TPR) repeat protein/predicted Ser/Thr protein kinase
MTTRDPKISDPATLHGPGADPGQTLAESSVGPRTAQAAFEPGTVLSERYEIIEVLGEGGMGAVYRAKDRETNRFVALKTIRAEMADSRDMLARFKQELVLARQVTHRNVIRIYDLGESNGIKYITMEFVEGEDIHTLLKKRGKLPATEAVEIIEQVCRALEAAHAEHVIHRDLKPQNIMREHTGRVVVMDFGLARTSVSSMTQTGALVGTMEYMSPEQALGSDIDTRSDIFAIGLILYELLSGKGPYAAESAVASLVKRSQERAVPVSVIEAGVPRALSDIVSKCLERDREQRYQTVSAVLADLDAWHGGAKPQASRVGLLSALRRRAITIGSYKWLALALLAVLIFAGVYEGWRKFSPPTLVHHASVSVLVADFNNQTGDPVFDDTLEPMFNVALEGASFINAFNRGQARKLAGKLPQWDGKLDERSARLVAMGQSIGAVVNGSLSRNGSGYRLSVNVVDAVTGKVIGTAAVDAQSKDAVLLAVPKLAAPIRKALGDTTPESVQVAASTGAFTAASLEAVHEYGVGMEQQLAGRMQDAFKSFSEAVKLDPNFARAYAGMAAVSGNLGQLQEANQYAKLAMEHVDRMTERERYRIRGLYYIRNENWQKCVDEYSDLVRRYPADNIGHNNLAGCYANLHNLPAAEEQVKQALQISPKDMLARMNLSLYACYAGDFATSEREARQVLQLNPAFEQAVLVVAYSQLGQGQLQRATDTYLELQKMSARGASLAASGLANLAMYQGKLKTAIEMLEKGAVSDLVEKAPDSAAQKFVMLAQAELMRGNERAASSAAERALAGTKATSVRFLAARILIAAHEPAKAREVAKAFASDLENEPHAYAKLIEGEIALQDGRVQEAVADISEANKIVDTWIGRFDLGRAYLKAQAYAQADSEFDRCLRRRGEAIELFMDDMPTYSYLPAVYYYDGRALDGLKSPGAADFYRTYLNLRGKAGEDALLPEVHRRLRQ